MKKGLIKLGIFFIFIIVGAVFGLLLAFPVMWCWNYAIVAIWKLPAITWGQAWCLNFLAGMLIQGHYQHNSKSEESTNTTHNK